MRAFLRSATCRLMLGATAQHCPGRYDGRVVGVLRQRVQDQGGTGFGAASPAPPGP